MLDVIPLNRSLEICQDKGYLEGQAILQFRLGNREKAIELLFREAENKNWMTDSFDSVVRKAIMFAGE